MSILVMEREKASNNFPIQFGATLTLVGKLLRRGKLKSVHQKTCNQGILLQVVWVHAKYGSRVRRHGRRGYGEKSNLAWRRTCRRDVCVKTEDEEMYVLDTKPTSCDGHPRTRFTKRV